MSDQTNSTPSRDPFGSRQELDEALGSPDLDAFERGGGINPEARYAAYQLATALGRCRAFGVAMGGDDGVLPVMIAHTASIELADLVQRWREQTRSLGGRWDQSLGVEGEALCLDLIEARMEAWVCTLTLDEAFRGALESADIGLADFRRVYDDAVRGIMEWDEELQAELELLASAAETNLLENWRQALAPQYRELLPWWLDGTLEAIAERSFELALESQPSPVSWRSLRERIAAVPMPAQLPSRAPFLPEFAPMAAAHVEESRPPRSRWWSSPDGSLTARMVIPGQPMRDDETLSLIFRHADDRSAALELAGQPVTLASVTATVDEQGKAEFSVQSFRSAGQDLRDLTVGHNATRWSPQDEAA
jgi:hypothetical protein